MDKRTLVIIVALAMPLVALALLSASDIPGPGAHVPSAKNKVTAARENARPQQRRYRHPENIDAMRSLVRERLKQLAVMTPAEWDEETKREWARRDRPATREAAIEINTKLLAELEAMTQQDWEKRRETESRGR